MASQQSQNTPRHAPKILKRIPPGYEQQRRSRRNQVPQQACEVPAQKQTAAAQPAPVQQCPAPQMQRRQGFSPIVANSQLTGYWRKEGGTRVFVHQAPPKEQPQQTTSAPHTQPTSAGTHASSSATQAKATPVVTTAPFKFRADAPAYVPATQMPAAVERTEGQAAVCAGEQAAAAVCAIDTAAAQTAAHKQPEQAAAEAAGADTAGAEQPEQAAAGLAAVEQASIEMSTADETAAAEPAAMDTAATDTGAAGQPEKATVEMTGAETAAAETTEGQLVSVNIFVRVFGSLTVTLRVADVLGATKDECSEAQASNEQQEQGISSEAQASNDQTGDSTAKADAYSSDKGADIAKLEMMFASAPDSPRIPAVMSGSVASHDSVDGALPFVMVSRRGTREDAPVARQDAPEVIKPRETEVRLEHMSIHVCVVYSLQHVCSVYASLMASFKLCLSLCLCVLTGGDLATS